MNQPTILRCQSFFQPHYESRGYIINHNPNVPLPAVETSLRAANLSLHLHFSKLDQIPQLTSSLTQHTGTFISDVRKLAKLPGGFPYAAILLVDFSINVLRSNSSCFHEMLNSRRTHIYWMLDQGLLNVCMDEWERSEVNSLAWPEATEPLWDILKDGMDLIPEWASKDRKALCQLKDSSFKIGGSFSQTDYCFLELWYFKQTRNFLEDSLIVYKLRKKVNQCLKGRLPAELADAIIDNVSEHESIPTNLRSKYLPSSKGKEMPS